MLPPVQCLAWSLFGPLNLCCNVIGNEFSDCDESLQAAATPPSFQLLSYKYVSDILEKRGPYREAHLAGARQKVDH